MAKDHVLSPEEIIDTARKAGYKVTKQQLRRWRDKGLINRPRKIGLGRGVGSKSLYLEGTDKQVIALCETLKKDRRLDLAAVALFFKGFPISNDYILEILRKELDKLKDDLKGLVDEGGLTSQGWEEFENLVSSRLQQRGLARARRRLRAKYFETFAYFLLCITLGKEFYVPLQGSDAVTDQDIIRRGLGFDKAQGIWNEIYNEALLGEISRLANRASLLAWEELLATVSNVELEAAIELGLVFWQYPQDLKAISRLVFGKDVFGLNGLPEIDLCEPNRQSPLLLLLFLCLRRMPEIDDQLQGLSKDAEYASWLRNHMENYPDLDQILPTVRSQLSNLAK